MTDKLDYVQYDIPGIETYIEGYEEETEGRLTSKARTSSTTSTKIESANETWGSSAWRR